VELNPGQEFGRYRIVREIGRGALGVAYLAEDTNLSRQVVLKVLLPVLSANDPFIVQFKREAETLAQLDHPGIVRIHAFDEIEEQWCIEMPFYEGGSLLGRMESSGLKTHESLFVMRDLLEALAYCHAVGVVHRDLKPSNVLLTSSGKAVIGDFGLAAALNRNFVSSMETGSTSGCFVGTPRYAPPEAWDQNDPSPAWDVYSTGLLFYEMYTGGYPFSAQSPFMLMNELMNTEVRSIQSSRPETSDDLEQFVERTMARDPSSRFQNAVEALSAFIRLPETTDIDWGAAVTLVPSRIQTSSLRPRRRRIAAFAAVAICLVLVAMTAVVWRFQESPQRANEQVTQQTSAPQNSEPVRDQVEMSNRSLIGEEAFRDLSKFGYGAYYVLDTYIEETGESYSNHWLSRLHTPADTKVVLAVTSKKIWYMTVTDGEDERLNFAGHWAHYEGPDNSFRHGTIQGQGVRMGKSAYGARLEFTEEDSTDVFVRTVMAANTFTSCTEFLWGAERANELMPLLYDDILPSGLAWGRTVESFFPCVADSRVEVPFDNDLDRQIVLDGRMTEGEWDKAYRTGAALMGSLDGRPGPRKPEMHLRYSDKGLYLGIKSFLPLDPQGIEFDVAIMGEYTIPAWQSERWIYTSRGPAQAHGTHSVDGEHVPWESKWQAAGATENGMWQAEVFIPFDDCVSGVRPEAGDRWRLNLCVREPARMPEQGEDVLRWGFPNLNQTEHGAILVFGPSIELRGEGG